MAFIYLLDFCNEERHGSYWRFLYFQFTLLFDFTTMLRDYAGVEVVFHIHYTTSHSTHECLPSTLVTQVLSLSLVAGLISIG